MNDPNQIPDTFFNFEHFFELSPDLLCIAGFDGYFKRINPAVSRVLGYSNKELTSRPIGDFIYEEDRILTEQSRAKLTQSKPLLNFENRYQTKNGDIIWLSWTSMPVESEKLVYAIAKNITDKKRFDESRNKHLADLTMVNESLKRLNYTTSHDLRSPVNNLLSLFRLLDASKINDEETREYIELLKTSTSNLSEILNNSVDTLIQKHQLHVKLEELNMGDILNSVLQSVSSIIHTSKASVIRDFSAFDSIYFNKAYLESIFLNLLSNSIKYGRPGVQPIIKISTRLSQGVKQLIVEDNGMGFDMKKVKNKIFGFNQKFHNHTNSKGIGLYLVYNHITSLNGTINIESEVNKGTRFIISFQEPEF
jgi:PAS domain S-box-containing protein